MSTPTASYDPAVLRYWTATLARWRNSGLSVRAFCHLHKLQARQLYAWRRRLADSNSASTTTPPQPTTPITFLQLPAASATPANLELRLASGHTLFIPPHFPPDSLRSLLAVLEGKSC